MDNINLRMRIKKYDYLSCNLNKICQELVI